MELEKKAEIISKLVQQWLLNNKKNECKPDDVIQFLKDNGVYSMNSINAKSLRGDLRKLHERNQMDLIRGLYFKQPNKNRLWFFKRVDV